MPPRRFAAIALIAVATLAGCGSSNDAGTAASASVDGDVVGVGAAPAPAPPAPGDGDTAGGIAGAVEVAAGALANADVAACSVDHQTIQTAVEAYELLNGALPASQQELVDAQLIREPSVRFEISPEGAVVASPGSPCS
jgi:uncharacterized lipoprotein